MAKSIKRISAGPTTIPTTSGNVAPMPTLHKEPIATPAVPEYTDAQLLSVIPPHTCAFLGDSGTGKSTLAAQYPHTGERPQLVIMFDPPAKAYPYQEGLEVQRSDDPLYAEMGMYADDCFDAESNWVRRIEYYIDPDPNQPRAAQNIEYRLGGFEASAMDWSSVVFDSMSFYQYACLRKAKHLFPMPAGKEQGSNLAWYNQVKEDVNRLVRSQAVWWPITSIFIFHTSEEKTEFASEVVRGMAAVGKLPTELPSGLAEMYRLYVQRSGDQYHHRVQTKHDGLWMATSIIAHAPSPCEANFRKLWANFLLTHSPK